jgi:hypothetical protein
MESPEIVYAWRIDSWLMEATEDLCAEAKERISLEIRAHLNDAVAAHEAEGHSPIEAQKSALEELGDANTAAKRFRKRHLTVKVDEFLNRQMISLLAKKPSKLVISIFCFAAILFLTSVAYYNGITTGHILIVLAFNCALISEIVVLTHCRKWAQSFSHKAAIKKIGIIKSANAVCWLSVLLVLMFCNHSASSLTSIAILLAIMLPNLLGVVPNSTGEFRWLRICLKLRNDRPHLD